MARNTRPSLGTADSYFQNIAARWLEGYCRLQPVTATQTGDHRFDGLIDDMSERGRGARKTLWKNLLGELGALDRSKLSRDNQVDAAILTNQLHAAIWDDEVLQSWAWDPQVYSGIAGNALYALLARDFAPLPARLKSATSRMERLPKLLAQMRDNLVLARVPHIHAETVAKQGGGVMEIVDGMILPQASVLDAAGQARLHSAAEILRKACADHQSWLDKTLVPSAGGDFRLGQKLFDEKLAFTLSSPMSRKDIRDKAEAAVIAVRGEMYDVARKALAGHKDAPPMPDAPTDTQQQAVIGAALELAYADKPPRDKVVEAAKTALTDATDFVRRKDLITLPDAPIDVVIMPEFARGVAVAYCDPPGPLDKGMKTFFDVSPIPDDWTAAQTDSFLREYNTRGITDVAVHEAMPGHYVQLWHANACPSVLRAVLSSGSFVEGWAVYAENLMAVEGFRNHDPLYRLVQLKVYLRSVTNAILDQVTNAILDQAIHVGRHQPRRRDEADDRDRVPAGTRAAGKWVRASLSSTQLSTYFVGRAEHDAIRAEYERRAGRRLRAQGLSRQGAGLWLGAGAPCPRADVRRADRIARGKPLRRPSKSGFDLGHDRQRTAFIVVEERHPLLRPVVVAMDHVRRAWGGRPRSLRPVMGQALAQAGAIFPPRPGQDQRMRWSRRSGRPCRDGSDAGCRDRR